MSIDRGHGIATSSVLADSYDLDALIADTEAAKVAALAAQVAAETAETNSETAETNSAASAVASAASAASITGAEAATAASAAAALVSENNAAADELLTNADAIATAADKVATNADVVTTNADVVLTNADVVLTNADVVSAEAAKNSAETALDALDDRWLGAKATDPTLDNDGNTLVDGAMYYDTTLNITKIYDLGTTTWKRTTPTTAEQATIDTVSGISANVTTVAGISADTTTVAGISGNVTTVAGNDANVTTVAGVSGNVTTVAGVSTNVTTVAGISADVTTVSGVSANVTTVAGISSDVTTVAADATDIGIVAAANTNIGLVGGSITNVNEVANNLGSVNAFGEQYRVAATAPTTSLDAGDLWFDTTAGTMKVYDGSGFVNAGSSVNGIENSVEHIATAGQTSFTATYDAGFLNVFLNGVKLDSTDYTATDGTNVVLDTGAALNDSVFVQSFGTFALADHYSKTASDARFEPIDATILKDADIGVTVLSPTGDGSGLTGLVSDPTMGGDLSGTASNAQIVANAVGTAEIANSAVTDAKIAGMSSSKLSGALPAIDGSALTGIADFKGFRARAVAGQSISSGTSTKVNYATELIDSDGWYNPTTSQFTPTTAGYYLIHADVRMGAMTSNGRCDIVIRVNAQETVSGGHNQTNSNDFAMVVTGIVYLDGNDYVDIVVNFNGGGTQTVSITNNTGGATDANFSGYFLGT